MTRLARAEDVAVGARLIADAGFDCLIKGAVVTVEQDKGGPFVRCSQGRHFLDGQLDEFGNYVGLSIVDLQAAA